MTFPVEVVLKGRDFAVTEDVSVGHDASAPWTDAVVRDLLVEILRAIDRAQNPATAASRTVVLHGFSWIVEPAGDQVVIAIEIPMGAAVAGPFSIAEPELTSLITRVLKTEREMRAPGTVH
jgi:hypothetical protein